MCGAGLSSSTWCCVFKDDVKESSLTRLRAAAEPLSLWSGSPSRSSLPCTSLTWARSSASSEESVPSSSLSSLVCQYSLTYFSVCPYIDWLCSVTYMWITFVWITVCEPGVCVCVHCRSVLSVHNGNWICDSNSQVNVYFSKIMIFWRKKFVISEFWLWVPRKFLEIYVTDTTCKVE